MESFDDETRNLINDIHHVWKSNASISHYAPLRDRIVTRRDKLDVQINTLSTVVRLTARRSPACQVQGDSSWQNFFALAATLTPEKDEDGEGTKRYLSLLKPKELGQRTGMKYVGVVIWQQW